MTRYAREEDKRMGDSDGEGAGEGDKGGEGGGG